MWLLWSFQVQIHITKMVRSSSLLLFATILGCCLRMPDQLKQTNRQIKTNRQNRNPSDHFWNFMPTLYLLFYILCNLSPCSLIALQFHYGQHAFLLMLLNRLFVSWVQRWKLITGKETMILPWKQIVSFCFMENLRRIIHLSEQTKKHAEHIERFM